MRKYDPNESMLQNINDTSSEQVPNANSSHARVPQTSRIPSVAENAPPSHGKGSPAMRGRIIEVVMGFHIH